MTDLGLSMLCSHFRFPLQKKMEQKEKKRCKNGAMARVRPVLKGSAESLFPIENCC